jgi:cysteine desulfurase
VHVSFEGMEAHRLVVALERRGVLVGTGSACAASKMRISHVLEAIGLPRDVAQGSLRLTLGRSTTSEDVDYALGAILDCVEEERNRMTAKSL